VHVKGTRSGTTITATEVNVQQGDETPGGGGDSVSVTGAISGLSGDCPTLQFTVGDKTIITSGSTRFLQTSCGSLADGMTVEVEGAADGSTIFASKVQAEDGMPGGGDDDATLRGALSGLSGQCPSLTFALQGKTVTTSAATVFKKGTCADVANGKSVEAEGILTGSTLAATKVSLEKNGK
jgi:hypothetical protein